MNRKERFIRELLHKADIKIVNPYNASVECKPYDIQLKPSYDKGFFERVYKNPFLGLPDSFMDNSWNCDDLVEFFCKIFKSGLADFKNYSLWTKLRLGIKLMPRFLNTWIFIYIKKWFKIKTRKTAFEVGQKHYDKGNELYKVMLGEDDMTYSCGIWNNVDDLKQAHEINFARACHHMKLQPGMRVLDVGCGNGSFLKYAAENYGVEGVGITVSEEQASFAREFCKDLPIIILVQDYRKLDDKYIGYFDAASSFGMFEHVQLPYYRTYFKSGARYLKPKGIFFLHTIASFQTVIVTDPFISRDIFQNSYIPTAKQTLKKAEKYFYKIKQYNVQPENYAKTLAVWYQRFLAGWADKLRDLYYDKVWQTNFFFNMWCYYLASCQALFKTHGKYVLQVVLQKK